MTNPLPELNVPTGASKFNDPAGNGFAKWFGDIKQGVDVLGIEILNQAEAKAQKVIEDAALDFVKQSPAGTSDDMAGGITDIAGTRTWLEFDQTGGPTGLAVQLLETAGLLHGKEAGATVPESLAITAADGTKLLAFDRAGRLEQWIIDYILDGINPQDLQPVKLVVKKDGTGDFTHPNDAIASIPAGGNPYLVEVHAGIYDTIDLTRSPQRRGLFIPDNVVVRGVDYAHCILRGYLPDGTDSAIMNDCPTVDLSRNGSIENLTVTGRNVRYPVHSESAGGFPDADQRTRNCIIESLGSWTGGGTAWGCGVSSATHQVHEGTTFIAPNKPVTLHNNIGFTDPIRFDFVHCSLYTSNDGGGLDLQSLGAGQPGVVQITDSDLSIPGIIYSDSPWKPTNQAMQLADHVELEAFVSGLDPVAYLPQCRGRALRLEASATGGEAVLVSGSAAALIFGSAPVVRLGGGGVATYLYGIPDISGILVGGSSNQTVNNTLGRLLGDCSANSKTLTVTVGATSVTVTFNSDLTAIPNSTILTQINSAITGVAVASIYDVSANERYPRFVDRERFLMNTSAVGIPKWAAVVFDTNARTVRLMASGDPANKFAGIALDQIAPGQGGKVLLEGVMSTSQMLGLVGATVNFRTSIFASDSSPGRFSLTGSRQIATGNRTGYAYFKGERL